MLTNKDLQDEIGKIEEVIKTSKNAVDGSQLKIGVLVLKLLQSVRTNQVLGLRKLGVELIKPRQGTQSPVDQLIKEDN